MEKLLTLAEAATLINVHPETLRRWDNDKTLVAVRVNDRGDRRYRESDILDFMSTHKTTISHAKTVDIDGYEVKWWSEEGFKTLSGNFHLIGKPYAIKDKEFIGFPFFVDFLEKMRSGISEDELDKLAMKKVTDYIKLKKVFDGDTATFEYLNNSFSEVQNPEWWEGKYGKNLVPGLRVEARTTCPVTVENIAWRVILYFKSKQGDSWLPTTYGGSRDSVEYFVWIDSKELLDLGLPNSQKGAEVLAVQFGVDRFEETKDANGDRSITRITEGNSARFDGKWIKDSLLPDELMK